jgi:uncharacterized protein
MTKIGLLSDTHSYIDQKTLAYFKDCDEIWHAGDVGHNNVLNQLQCNKPLRGVYGNIDDNSIKDFFPLQQVFYSEQVKVLMRHIGGYPPKYNVDTKRELITHKPQLFITGHSHILKIMHDPALNCLCINPGAAGHHGWHTVRTIVTFCIDGQQILNCNVIELGKRGIVKTV